MEKLNLIQSLRCELTELNEQKNIKVENLKELDERYKINVNQSKELSVELCDMKNEFIIKKVKKCLIFTFPIGFICAIITFFVWNNSFISSGLFDYVLSTAVSGLVFTTICGTSYLFASNDKLDKFLINIFPKLQVYYDKIKLLRNNFNKKIDEIENILEQKNTLNFLIHSIDGKIQEKKQELDGLTNDYFDNIENDHIVDEKDNIFMPKENKGKIRVRTPKNI